VKLLPPALLALALLAACNEQPLKQAPPDAGAPVGGLSAEQAARVVAKVGDRTITLGDYARTLERMDQFDRLRYQSKERRRELLEEMIDVELLAAEAKRLSLDKDPEAQDQLRLVLRDAMQAQGREGSPGPAQISEAEVRAYYDAHLDKFTEPERRRVAAIVMTDKKEAQKVLKEAQKAKTAPEWGALFFKHSLTAPKQPGATNPAELAGDLGIVGPLDDARGANERVPPAVRAEAYKLKAVGEVAAELVEADGKVFIVRLNGITAAHKRSVQESDRSIRVLLVQEKLAERDKALEAELRRKFPVEIDEKALSAVKVPVGPAGNQDAVYPKEREQAADGGH
jgi:hypothetical protein